MSRIDAVLLILLMCVISTGVLIVLRWALKWSPARRFINAGIGSIIVFMALMFLVFTFGKNSYDSAFNKAFAQYFNVPTEDKRIIFEQETKRKMSAPSKACNRQSVKVRHDQSLTSRSLPNVHLWRQRNG